MWFEFITFFKLTPYKFMSGYLHFPDNWNDMKNHI